MALDVDLGTFTNQYYNTAKKTADIVIANSVATNGAIDARIDVELVKELGAVEALEKVYYSYDPAKAGNAKLTTFLAKVVSNCVLSQLSKATTDMKRTHLENKRKKPKPKAEEPVEGAKKAPRSYEGSAIMPGIKGAGNEGIIMEAHEYMMYSGKFKRKEDIIKDMMRKLRQLPEFDYKVLEFWMQDPDHYIEKVIEYFGCTDMSRNAIQIRKFKALAKLRELMGGKRPDYTDIYVSSRSKAYTADDGMLSYNDMRKRKSELTALSSKASDYKSTAERIYTALEKK